MSYKHFTLEQKNQLSVLLRTKTKKKEIAKLLRKGRTTIWKEQKRGMKKRQDLYYPSQDSKTSY
ncbi:MAG: helix-turn-helix domain-containing protein [Candidatus Nealsonbacteria bacterium]|nr:helix-turn-helix domain-containing protein [Candidatus Nealsonbacteria bacterium]